MAALVTSPDMDMIGKCSKMISGLIGLRARNPWIDCDKDADVLYFSFRKPQHATRTIEASGDILVRKNGNTVVGITVLNASCH